MYHDGKTYIWIPSALTLSFSNQATCDLINAVHAAINAQLGANYKKTDYAPSMHPHEYYYLLNDLDMGGAPFTRDAEPGLAVCGPIENVSYISGDYAAVIVAFGSDIEGLPVWFELDDPDSICPLGNGTETWNQWGVFGDSHKPVQLGAKWYRSSAVGQSGQLLDASAWVGLRAAGQLVVKTKAEYLAIQAANQPSLP